MLVANTSSSENGHKLLKSGSFPINQDILLLQEVLAHNPFSSNPADINKVWEKIARSVSATDEDFMLDGFRCQKRTNLLMDWFKQGDSASLRRLVRKNFFLCNFIHFLLVTTCKLSINITR